MGLSNDFIVFGINNLTCINKTDRKPYGIFKVIGGGQISLSAEFEDLFGGAQRFAYASEAKTIASEFTANVKSFPNFLFSLFLGATVSETAASATGTVGSLSNSKGTSVFEASTGIATITAKAGSENLLKTGKYFIVAVTATTFDAYMTTDVDGDLFQNDALKITESPLTVTASTAVEIPNTGLEATGGSGTIDLGDAGNVAELEVASAHGGVDEIVIGEAGATFPEHEEVAYSAKRSNGDLMEMTIHKAVGAGFPISLEEQAYSIPELTVKLLYDNCVNRIATIRKVRGQSGSCS